MRLLQIDSLRPVPSANPNAPNAANSDESKANLYPELPGFKQLWNTYVQTFTELGNDPIVGRKLVSLLHEAGATPGRNTWIFFGSCSGNELFNVYVNNLVGVIAGVRETMLHHGLFDEKRFNQVTSSFGSSKERPDSALWYAVAWAEGVRSR